MCTAGRYVFPRAGAVFTILGETRGADTQRGGKWVSGVTAAAAAARNESEGLKRLSEGKV